MIDSFTKKRIRVVDDEGDEPYIIVRVNQLDAIKGILDRAGCHYDVDDEEVSVNGHPFVTIVESETRCRRRGHPEEARRRSDPKMARRRRSRSGHRG